MVSMVEDEENCPSMVLLVDDVENHLSRVLVIGDLELCWQTLILLRIQNFLKSVQSEYDNIHLKNISIFINHL